MNLLLDTHALIWWDQKPEKLSPKVHALIEDWSNTVFISVVNVWEALIKIDLGKLKLDNPIHEIVDVQVRENDFRVLPVRLNHVFALEGLPNHHKDPFDRLLIAQGIADDLTILTKDDVFSNYPARCDW